jgi:hypothetical protein
VSALQPDWRAVERGLDRTRGSAFATGSSRLLEQVYAPRSAALLADRAALAELRSRRVTTRGLAHRLLGVAQGAAPARGTVSLVVTEQLSGYALVDGRGRVVERHTAGPVLRVVMVLTQTGGGWRVVSVGRDP